MFTTVLKAATALALAASFTVLPSTAADASVKTGTSCYYSKYHPHYTITSATKAPKITHIRTYSMPPSSSHSVTKSASYYQRLSASVGYSSGASISASGISRVLGEASAKVNMTLKAAGARTSTTSVSVTDTIANHTGHNVQFVFYKGWTKAWGSFRHYYCRQYYVSGQNYGPWFVTYDAGSWRSFNIPGSGAVSCAAGTRYLGALARAAYHLGCPA